MKIRNDNWQEGIIYLLLWMILFIVPAVVIQYHHSADGGSYPWAELFALWRQFAVFFVAFLIHNFVLAPLIVYRRRHLLYFSSIALLLACFVAVQCVNRPEIVHHKERPAMMGGGHHPHPPMHDDRFPGDDFADGQRPPEPRHDDGPDDGHRPDGPGRPLFVGQHDFVATIMLVLMLGMNLGVKLYFRQRKDEKRMADLERQNLEQQLDFLRYQINPHFLMNTLNNIHALVDIEPEQAKETIVGLSKILRFVLYDGAKQMVPLDRELAFLTNYIELMGLRVAEQVDLTVQLPTQASDVLVPPLLFITFVENAFKHGVSYQQHSFIDIQASVADGQVCFTCRNSKVPPTSASRQGGGVGLQNARKRLDLIYGDRYTLRIDEDAETYCVTLDIPVQTT
ncbi:MAG: histidine kinase [Prevotella sp.]|nr:histidine kinase [Prevotella sp.]